MADGSGAAPAAPSFPPMLRGQSARDPWAEAMTAARAGCDGGTIFWRAGDALEAAVVLAPDVPRDRAAQMIPLAAVALRDALGAIGPPEMPVHLGWDGSILLNGAEAGQVRGMAPPGAGVPDWLIVHLHMRFLPEDSLDRTALWQEGAGEVMPVPLLESWSRHLLHRLSEWEDGPRPLHAEWLAAMWDRAHDKTFLGLDEAFGRLRRDGAATTLDPLDTLLETP
ncbi:hypothetical protein JSE7799_01711 [Jannaschia seosinensis]|uniref:BPL/LPL catalytic domain-containing protein n=1 Tax=Jannaschia seosinensis TaxID=313367 RepID=A0A0M7BAZ6_9RHOB|nr:biotin/lipoate--protein ligase family protein [Jannaschia seosinensis]CUH38992.1 hypothetical protein JSE7799_01711 [Jannaschia seosinensis]